MSTLTIVQKQAVRDHIAGTPALAALRDAVEYGQLAAALNAPASPDYYVWKTRLTKHEVTDLQSPTGTTFMWGGSTGGYINRSQGERDAWKELWNDALEVNPSLDNVRTAFLDIFSGAGAGAQNNRAHLDSMAKRKATIAERLFVQSVANGAVGTPDKLGWEGLLVAQDMSEIVNS